MRHRMYRRELDRAHLAHHEDWQGEIAAFTCPVCDKVFIVNAEHHPHGRPCPHCGRSTGHVRSASHAAAWVEWSPEGFASQE